MNVILSIEILDPIQPSLLLKSGNFPDDHISVFKYNYSFIFSMKDETSNLLKNALQRVCKRNYKNYFEN